MRGHNPAWANLPRRKCDQCGKTYKPVQPLREKQAGFCSKPCRESYHKHGGSYRKLKPEVEKMVRKEFSRFDAELKELRKLCGELQAGVIILRSQVGPYDVDEVTRQLVFAKLGERESLASTKHPAPPAARKSNPRYPS